MIGIKKLKNTPNRLPPVVLIHKCAGFDFRLGQVFYSVYQVASLRLQLYTGARSITVLLRGRATTVRPVWQTIR